jgi:hyperosmotically inducible protein
MRPLRVINVVSGALVILASFNAYAQSSDATVAPNAMASSSATGKHLSNRTLGKNVLRALEKTHGLSASNISVRARNGAVTLEGSVPDEEQSDLATRTAQGVSGVTSVKNTLTLEHGGS